MIKISDIEIVSFFIVLEHIERNRRSTCILYQICNSIHVHVVWRGSRHSRPQPALQHFLSPMQLLSLTQFFMVLDRSMTCMLLAYHQLVA